MRRLPFNLFGGMRFSKRLDFREQKFNLSLDSNAEAIVNTRFDTNQFQVGGIPKRLISWFGRTYTITHNGGLWNNANLIDNGLGKSSMVVATPTAATFEQFLYVAGTNRMKKYRTTDEILNWGIDPPSAALTPAVAGGTATIDGRYAYLYYSQITNQRSNLSPITDVFDSGGQEVLLSGFVASSDIQVSHQIIARTGPDGIFHELSFKLNDNNTFLDQVNDVDLVQNEVILNHHGTPPLANLVIIWRGSVWLNDISNRQRIWISVPGLMGSFEVAGIYDIGEANDEVRGFAVVSGNLYIWTQNKVYMPTGSYPTFRFDPIADLGLVSSYALSAGVDQIIFGSHSGIWSFNGASFTQLPEIWTLFDPNSLDPRRFTGVDSDNFITGGDDRFIWTGWTRADNTQQTFQYSLHSQAWTERDPISIVNPNHDPFYIQAGDYLGFVKLLNNSPTRNLATLMTEEIEFEAAELVSVEIEYLYGPLHLWIHLGQWEYYLGQLAFTSNKFYTMLKLPEGIYSRRAQLRVQKSEPGDMGLLTANLWIKTLPLATVVYDSGEVPIGYYEQQPQDLIIHYVVGNPISLNFWVYIDGQIIYQDATGFLGPGTVGPIRFTLPPIKGRAARFRMESTTAVDYFALLSVMIGKIPLGDNKIQPSIIGGEYNGPTSV